MIWEEPWTANCGVDCKQAGRTRHASPIRLERHDLTPIGTKLK
ncbi:MAG: hypothetical protein ACI8X5_001506 [Planctomycetota bacterium]|jgi:hypothetical protein